ncbi:unnamed protein product [Thelazia callipaeda]|uniref:GTD-binding domain-containing protein n=1 Tax=Thelazia callipaeda TaxID=103827 RepID=A0A0N5DBT2_THECL|nr:unnamed protein product [Thelazia callipaeda]
MADIQRRLQELRSELDDSIESYCSRQQTWLSHCSNVARSVFMASSIANRRVLHILHQNQAETSIQISKLSIASFL